MSSRSITQLSPLSFPELDITVDHFRHGETSLGSLRLETSSLQNGLSIDQFMVTGAEHELNSTGNWLIQESHPVMALQGSLSSRNLAHFLHQFGIYEDIRKTSAMIDFDLDWQSSPIQIDWQSLNGSIQFKLEHGRLLGVEPGIGRALGLFSLNAWERRLRLDFSDVVDEGFAYDNVKADFVLKKGQAYSTNLAVDGVSARVKFVGRIGLHERDFEAAVTVIPRSSIALPLAGALGGPIGLGAGIVAQQIVGDQFETLSSSRIYRFRLLVTSSNQTCSRKWWYIYPYALEYSEHGNNSKIKICNTLILRMTLCCFVILLQRTCTDWIERLP